MPLRRAALALAAVLLCVPWPTLAADGDLCVAAIERAERERGLPAGLLSAVAFTESGRPDPERRRAVAWPWTVNNAGDGRFFASKEEAIAQVEALRRDGRRNIDVGCMQINLMHHPDAFASLDEAFDPAANVAYGADFLGRLRAATGSWEEAVQRYNSADERIGGAYRAKVYERWQDLRLAEAVPTATPAAVPAAGAAAGGALGPRRLEPAAGSWRAPAAFPRRLAGTAGLLATRGYLSLSGRASGVAVLRPSAPLRPVRGVIRTDGSIEGSRLRLGPRRWTVGEGPAATPAAGPPAKLRRLPARWSG